MENDLAVANGHPKRRYKRLSPTEWSALCALYATGGATLVELADRYGVSVRSIQLHLRETGTEKGDAARAVVDAAQAEILTRALPTATSLADRIKETKDAAYNDAAAIQSIIRKTLADVATGAVELSAPARMRLADQAAHSLDRVHRLQRTILGIDHNDAMDRELPELPIRVLTDEEVEEIRAGHDAEDAETGMTDSAEIEAAELETISEGD